ncbi:hypothetical protein KFE25_004169 [Diacronema lutheri]|uniref:Uncharacterized protein n=1 Tax=Diacronema lutheri TaxID=2081491 RepID=A0A8J5X1S7_DIALT|nr:hypothetical protein KFE25_004169 [Diacronema lutheri]
MARPAWLCAALLGVASVHAEINASKASITTLATAWLEDAAVEHESLLHWMVANGAGTNNLDGDGADMFDGGNFLNVYTSTEEALALPYADDCANILPWASAGIADVVYKTCFVNSAMIAVFVSRRKAIQQFRVTGNLGADSIGRVGGNVAPLTRTASGNTLEGWYKFASRGTDYTVQDLNDAVCPDYPWSDRCDISNNTASTCSYADSKATVNHLILAPPGARHSVSCDTNIDLDSVTWRDGDGVSLVALLVWGGMRYDETFRPVPATFDAERFADIFGRLTTPLLASLREDEPKPAVPLEGGANNAASDDAQAINIEMLIGSTVGAFGLGVALVVIYFKLVRPALIARRIQMALHGVAIKGDTDASWVDADAAAARGGKGRRPSAPPRPPPAPGLVPVSAVRV